MRLMRFKFDVVYVPGRELITPDVLSRVPLKSLKVVQPTLTAADMEKFVVASNSGMHASDQLLKIRQAQESDDWPPKHSIPLKITPYWQESGSITCCDGLLLNGTRLTVPEALKVSFLNFLHDGHQGIGRTRAKFRSQVAESVIPLEIPEYPWQKVRANLFDLRERTSLLVVDYLLRYPEIAYIEKTTSAWVIQEMKSIFARHGIAECLITDNGPQFVNRAFSDFAQHYGFAHTTSNPRYPQAERMVKTIKRPLEKAEDAYLALFAYRSTSGPVESSPAEILMGRRLRTRVPLHQKLLLTTTRVFSSHRQRDKKFRQKQSLQFNRRHAATKLPPLNPGEAVLVKHLQRSAQFSRKPELLGPISSELRTTIP
ncbi:uncharacterized protein K02A2.6-like [Ornithodoros turicata]|uniref:uncharacterized protein K02A2.6-like n=1 Tax=Ornithodoros turicata TaxID=34597 RepID=UPI003139286D